MAPVLCSYATCGDRSKSDTYRLKSLYFAILVLVVCFDFRSPGWAETSPDPSRLEAGFHHHIIFSEYSPLAQTDDLLKRTLSPLALRAIEVKLVKSGKELETYPVDLTKESFILYVPSHKPPHGYGLMVFVPPWQEAIVPPKWAAILDQYGLIFVSAERSGNDENVLGRRIPLALLETDNIVKQYHVDPNRIYIAGMSGGSRVALRLAIDYPDVFSGALLNAGSDAVGVAPDTLPDDAVMAKLRSSSRIVYVTGEQDDAALSEQYESTDSLLKFCVYDFEAEVTPSIGHTVASPQALSQAIRSLSEHAVDASGKQSSCSAGIKARLMHEVDDIKALIKSKRTDAARLAIIRIDNEFGGMAAAYTLELARDCSCELFQ